MCKDEKNNRIVMKTAVRGIGIVLCVTAIILRLCGNFIGGAVEGFCDAALPWITIGVAVAVVLSVRSDGREDEICEKQNTRIEKKS